MEYVKCLVELDAVLDHLSKEYLKRIPEDILKCIREQKDKKYVWEYDETKELEEQNLDRKTIIMLSYINLEYLLNTEQKELMKKFHDINEKKQEKEKKEKYNVDNLFNKGKYNAKINVIQQKSTDISVIEHKKWYSKIFDFIKNIFRKK